MSRRRMSYPWTSSGRRWTRLRPTPSTKYLLRNLHQHPNPRVPPSSVHVHAPLLHLRRLRSRIIPTPSPLHFPRLRRYHRTPWKCEKRSPARARTTRRVAAANVSSCDVFLRLEFCLCSSRSSRLSGHVVRDSSTSRFFSCTILPLTAFRVFPSPAWDSAFAFAFVSVRLVCPTRLPSTHIDRAFPSLPVLRYTEVISVPRCPRSAPRAPILPALPVITHLMSL